jgi:hypothetical protein
MKFLILLLAMFVAAVLGHPSVSNPHQTLTENEPDIQDLYALHPDQKPLHTTALMAMGKAQATAGTKSRGNGSA